MAIGRLHHLLLHELEVLADVVFQDLPAYLDRDFIVELAVVKQERSVIDPDSPLLQGATDSLHIVKDVVSCVEEKTCCHPFEILLSFFVHLRELPSTNCEVRLLLHIFHFFRRRDVGDKHASKGIFLVIVVLEGTDEGEYLELLLVLGSVDDEVGAEQHKVSDFVSLCPEPCADELVDQPAESAPRNQDVILRFEIVLHFGDHPSVVILLLAVDTPLPIELLDRRLDFAPVARGSGGVGLEMLFFLHFVDVLENLVQEGLVVAQGLLEHDGFPLPVGGIVLVEGGFREKGCVILLEVPAVIGESTFDFILVAELKLFGGGDSVLVRLFRTVGFHGETAAPTISLSYNCRQYHCWFQSPEPADHLKAIIQVH